MRLILGISRDGFLARTENDDMRWLGPIDKAIFRILTGINGTLIVSKKTAQNMPALEGRKLIPVSSSEFSLEEAAAAFEDAWLIGGPTLALIALKGGLIHETILCVSDRYAFPTSGIQGSIEDKITPFLEASPSRS